jgi:hypothetical protein
VPADRHKLESFNLNHPKLTRRRQDINVAMIF